MLPHSSKQVLLKRGEISGVARKIEKKVLHALLVGKESRKTITKRRVAFPQT